MGRRNEEYKGIRPIAWTTRDRRAYSALTGCGGPPCAVPGGRGLPGTGRDSQGRAGRPSRGGNLARATWGTVMFPCSAGPGTGRPEAAGQAVRKVQKPRHRVGAFAIDGAVMKVEVGEK